MTFWIECLAGSVSGSDGWSGAYDGMRPSRSGSTGRTATVGPVPPDALVSCGLRHGATACCATNFF